MEGQPSQAPALDTGPKTMKHFNYPISNLGPQAVLGLRHVN